MGTTPIVLCVNHLQHNCGVYQMFKRYTASLIDDKNYYYIETNHEWEHDHWVNQLNPDIVLYNFYFSGATMPWLTESKIASQKGRFKQMSIHHEGNIDNKGFDLILHQDPTNTDTRYFNLPRCIVEYTPDVMKTYIPNIFPTIGSFGFGLGGKGFTRVVEQVMNEYDVATIRMNIPFAYFGDSSGDGARWWASACQAIAANKPSIDLRITHDLLPEQELLEWLAMNDINCFFYDDNIGRGISGTVDYALAVHKPIAITKSDQFRHIWNDDIILTPTNGIKEIISRGIKPLEQHHDKWNKTTLINAFNEAFNKVLGR